MGVLFCFCMVMGACTPLPNADCPAVVDVPTSARITFLGPAEADMPPDASYIELVRTGRGQPDTKARIDIVANMHTQVEAYPGTYTFRLIGEGLGLGGLTHGRFVVSVGQNWIWQLADQHAMPIFNHDEDISYQVENNGLLRADGQVKTLRVLFPPIEDVFSQQDCPAPSMHALTGR